jgi:hypothetical protein
MPFRFARDKRQRASGVASGRRPLRRLPLLAKWKPRCPVTSVSAALTRHARRHRLELLTDTLESARTLGIVWPERGGKRCRSGGRSWPTAPDRASPRLASAG